MKTNKKNKTNWISYPMIHALEISANYFHLIRKELKFKESEKQYILKVDISTLTAEQIKDFKDYFKFHNQTGYLILTKPKKMVFKLAFYKN